MSEFFREFTRKILIWGSDDVIVQWTKYRKCLLEETSENPKENASHITSMFELEKLLIAIRKDTGHKSSNIEKGDLLRLFINDIDDYL